MKDKKLKKAVALRYDQVKEDAPRVTAKGQGRLAEKIIQLALDNGVPIKNDPDLVEVLSQLDLQEEIPPEIYVAVAELLAFVYSINSDRTAKQPSKTK